MLSGDKNSGVLESESGQSRAVVLSGFSVYNDALKDQLSIRLSRFAKPVRSDISSDSVTFAFATEAEASNVVAQLSTSASFKARFPGAIVCLSTAESLPTGDSEGPVGRRDSAMIDPETGEFIRLSRSASMAVRRTGAYATGLCGEAPYPQSMPASADEVDLDFRGGLGRVPSHASFVERGQSYITRQELYDAHPRRYFHNRYLLLTQLSTSVEALKAMSYLILDATAVSLSRVPKNSDGSDQAPPLPASSSSAMGFHVTFKTARTAEKFIPYLSQAHPSVLVRYAPPIVQSLQLWVTNAVIGCRKEGSGVDKEAQQMSGGTDPQRSVEPDEAPADPEPSTSHQAEKSDVSQVDQPNDSEHVGLANGANQVLKEAPNDDLYLIPAAQLVHAFRSLPGEPNVKLLRESSSAILAFPTLDHAIESLDILFGFEMSRGCFTIADFLDPVNPSVMNRNRPVGKRFGSTAMDDGPRGGDQSGHLHNDFSSFRHQSSSTGHAQSQSYGQNQMYAQGPHKRHQPVNFSASHDSLAHEGYQSASPVSKSRNISSFHLLKMGELIGEVTVDFVAGNRYFSIMDVVTPCSVGLIPTGLSAHDTMINVANRTKCEHCKYHVNKSSYTLWKVRPVQAEDAKCVKELADLWEYFVSKERIGFVQTERCSLYLVPAYEPFVREISLIGLMNSDSRSKDMYAIQVPNNPPSTKRPGK